MNTVSIRAVRGHNCFILLASLFLPAHAFEIADSRFFFETGFEIGGDELVDEDGFGFNTIRANAGLNLAVGALFDLEGESLDGELLISAGYLSEDGDSEFSVSRVNLVYLLAKPNSRHRIGAGITLHIDPEVDVDETPSCTLFFCQESDFPPGKTRFDDAAGLILRYEYVLGDFLRYGFSYTLIEYQSDVKDVDGNGFGLYFYLPLDV